MSQSRRAFILNEALLPTVAGLFGFLYFLYAVVVFEKPIPTRVLLLGDSTTIGNVCREVDPHAPQYEQILTQVL